MTSVADAAGTTSYTYDNADRLSTLSDPATGTTATYSCNSDSLVDEVSYGSDARYLGYNSLHQLTSDALKTPAGATVASESYGYNADGQITSLNTTGLAGASSSTYSYDEAGRVTSWDNGTSTTDYAYDNNGNLTRSGAKTHTYDTRDELTGDGTSTYTYTARGTMASKITAGGTVASSYDAYGDQVSAGAQQYAYDALGRMTSDVNSSTQAGYAFSYAGSSATIASDGVSTYTWDPSGTILTGIGAPGGSTPAGELAFTDAHGDVLGQFTSSASSVSGSAGYDPWGAVTATTGTLAGRLGFQSGWTDPATGQVAMGARWYDPAAGDFDSADTVQVSPVPDPAMANPFGYVGDDPLDGTDPTGHCWSGFGWACSAAHTVAHTFDTARHAAASAFDSAVGFAADFSYQMYQATRSLVSAAYRAARNVATHVYDAARSGIRAVHTVIQRTWAYTTRTYHAVTHYASGQFHRVVHVVRTAYHHAVNAVHRARDAVVKVARTVVRHAAAAAAWVGHHVQRAAVATGHFAARHAALIGGAVTGIAVFAGCEAATAGAGTLGCAAAAGAASNAVSYAISAAQSHSFSWSGLGKSALTGAAEGAVGGGLGELASAAGSMLSADAASTLADSTAAEAGDAAAGDAAGQGSGGLTCGGESFTAGTKVLLASGALVAISKLAKGERVLATDTRTGKNQAETVAAVLVHHDTDLYDLKVRSGSRTAVIATTSNHLFWVPYLHYGWIPANHLKPGMHLKTSDGQTAVVVGGSVPAVHDGWMWDLTVPGNNDHDFYVIASDVGILVHNCGSEDLNYNQIRERIDSHTWPTHGFGTEAEGTKFAEDIDQQDIFQGLVEKISPDNETGVIDDVTGNHEHIIPWPGVGANGENFVRVWMTPQGGLGGIWPIGGP